MPKKPRILVRFKEGGSREHYIAGTEILKVVEQKNGICRLKADTELLKTSRKLAPLIDEMVEFYHALKEEGFEVI